MKSNDIGRWQLADELRSPCEEPCGSADALFKVYVRIQAELDRQNELTAR